MGHTDTNGFPIIDTPRLRLRRPKDSDVKPYLALSQDDDVMRYFGREPLASEVEATEVLNWLDGLFKAKTGIGWIIADASTDTCLGDISFPAPEYVAEHARQRLGSNWQKPGGDKD